MVGANLINQIAGGDVTKRNTSGGHVPVSTDAGGAGILDKIPMPVKIGAGVVVLLIVLLKLFKKKRS